MFSLKKVLITGSNSYVGTNVEKWLLRETEKYYVETLDMRDPNWQNFDFTQFDVVFHVAGIAHVSTKKSMKDLYFKVNRDLTIETAQKAKKSGVKQFIFMSSMIVYSSKETMIKNDTKPNPDNFYGMSKLQAEDGVLTLSDESFIVSILRPPMIYGSNSKGNLLTLSKVVEKIKVFPNISNKRSILNINNLSNVVKGIIDNETSGILFPFDKGSFGTTEIIISILAKKEKKIILTKLFNPFIRFLVKYSAYFKKIFGDYYYFEEMNGRIIEYINFDINGEKK